MKPLERLEQFVYNLAYFFASCVIGIMAYRVFFK